MVRNSASFGNTTSAITGSSARSKTNNCSFWFFASATAAKSTVSSASSRTSSTKSQQLQVRSCPTPSVGRLFTLGQSKCNLLDQTAAVTWERHSPEWRYGGPVLSLTSALLSVLRACLPQAGLCVIFSSFSTKKKREPTSPPPLRPNRRNPLFMAGVRDPRHDVAPAVRHRGACEFRAFRRTPLTHRRVDGCRPLVHAIGTRIGNDQAARRRRRIVYILLVEAVVRGRARLDLLLKRRHQELLEHCGVSIRLLRLRIRAHHSQVRRCSATCVVHRRLHQVVFVLGRRDLARPRTVLANFVEHLHKPRDGVGRPRRPVRISLRRVYNLLKRRPANDRPVSRQLLHERHDRFLAIFRVGRPIRPRHLELAYKCVHSRRRFHLRKSDRRTNDRQRHQHQAHYHTNQSSIHSFSLS